MKASSSIDDAVDVSGVILCTGSIEYRDDVGDDGDGEAAKGDSKGAVIISVSSGDVNDTDDLDNIGDTGCNTGGDNDTDGDAGRNIDGDTGSNVGGDNDTDGDTGSNVGGDNDTDTGSSRGGDTDNGDTGGDTTICSINRDSTDNPGDIGSVDNDDTGDTAGDTAADAVNCDIVDDIFSGDNFDQKDATRRTPDFFLF